MLYEILIMLIFGVIGYVMRKTGFEPAPLLFAMVIGPIMETALRQSLLASRGISRIFSASSDFGSASWSGDV